MNRYKSKSGNQETCKPEQEKWLFMTVCDTTYAKFSHIWECDYANKLGKLAGYLIMLLGLLWLAKFVSYCIYLACLNVFLST